MCTSVYSTVCVCVRMRPESLPLAEAQICVTARSLRSKRTKKSFFNETQHMDIERDQNRQYKRMGGRSGHCMCRICNRRSEKECVSSRSEKVRRREACMEGRESSARTIYACR